MAKWTRKTDPRSDVPGTVGTVRMWDRAGVGGVRRGDIVVVNTPDLDRHTAEALVKARAAAVLNVTTSTSGRYPNLGPRILAESGIPLVDSVGAGAETRLKPGEQVRVHDGSVFRNGMVVVAGTAVDLAEATSGLEGSSRQFATSIDSLAANAIDHLHREHELLIEGHRVPSISTVLKDRPVVVVSDAFDVAADLKAISRFMRDHSPVLMGAGPGADVLLAAGLSPDIVVGSLDHISDRAISKASEIVVVASSGRLTDTDRLDKHGKGAAVFAAAGTDEEMALLLADTWEANIIIHAGAAPTLVDFLGQGPAQTGSAFVARLRTGSRLIDAKAVGRFYRHRIAWWPVLALLVGGVVAVGASIATTPVGADWFDAAFDWIRGLV